MTSKLPTSRTIIIQQLKAWYRGNRHLTGIGILYTLARQIRVELSTRRGADGTMKNTTRYVLATNQIKVIGQKVDSQINQKNVEGLVGDVATSQ